MLNKNNAAGDDNKRHAQRPNTVQRHMLGNHRQGISLIEDQIAVSGRDLFIVSFKGPRQGSALFKSAVFFQFNCQSPFVQLCPKRFRGRIV